MPNQGGCRCLCTDRGLALTWHVTWVRSRKKLSESISNVTYGTSKMTIAPWMHFYKLIYIFAQMLEAQYRECVGEKRCHFEYRRLSNLLRPLHLHYRSVTVEPVSIEMMLNCLEVI
ncbi:hypothetical protein EVAR_33401_1 [Eumeta japonica]|uniref:Uncharacterized protein n=1 Tax=Eumeta variegata TaxID=151549 RepID=A0A4C1W472_EUMVA|nr:hypothetical protein EVAR_33401_1 [Eumeta japonica]